jgi:hypothetical protein
VIPARKLLSIGEGSPWSTRVAPTQSWKASVPTQRFTVSIKEPASHGKTAYSTRYWNRTTQGLGIVVAPVTAKEHKGIFLLCHYFATAKCAVKSKWLRNTTKFYRRFTNATRPRRRRLTDALGQHAALRTRIFPTPARTLATAPDPCARAAQHPPRSARDAI